MKKIFVLLMIAIMTLSAFTCAEVAETPESIALNEMKTTTNFEVTLVQVDFAKSLVDGSGALKDLLLPTDAATTINAADGKTFLVYTADLNFIGKENLNAVIGNFVLNYADGYTFDDCRVQILRDDGKTGWTKMKQTSESGSVSMQFCSFEPLIGTKYILRGYFEVPEIVMAEEAEPLTMTVNILGEQFTYTIR